MAILISNKAIEEVKKVKLAQNLGDESVLRIAILGGGCSGMQYSLGFDTEFNPMVDTRYDFDGVSLVTRKEYDLFLDGTEISFVDTPPAKGFAIDNPNFPAGSGCPGCGH